MPVDSVVSLTVGGKIHEGWTAVAVDLHLDHLAGAFSLTVTDEWVANGTRQRLAIAPGAACRVAINGETVITGYVDEVEPGYDGGRHDVSVRGRDRTGDLVDCSAEIGEFHNQKLEAIVAALAAPFGVSVRTVSDTGEPFVKFAVNPGDAAGDCIERLLRQRGTIAWADGLGGLVIGLHPAAEPVATLARGVNVLSAGATTGLAERFSTVTAHVQGWRHGSGLWRPGDGVIMNDDWLRVSGRWLVSGVCYRKDSSGTRASLTLVPPDAFDRAAEPETGGASW